ncbi:MAG: MFS transporter [Leucobacter sp.]
MDRQSGRVARATLIGALVCGGFGIGVSEFIVMGLLPQMAADFLPDLYASRPEAALAASGGLASAYALGVVVGMVVTPVVIRRLPERSALLVCAGSMLLWTLLMAFAPTLPIALILRFLAALTHAAYIGVGAMVAAHMLGSNNYGLGSAIVHGGLTGANLLGVPALTALGATWDWRVILGLAALLFAVPFVALLLISPAGRAEYVAAGGSGGRRFGPRFFVLGLAAVFVAASGFAVVTYVAPLVEWAQGAGGWLTAATGMLAFGIGMNIGNWGAGWLADRAAGATFVGSAAAGILGGVLLLIPNIGSPGTAAAMLLVGLMLGGGSPAAQVLFMRELPRFPRLASSMPSGTANLGSFVGSLVGAGLLAGVGPMALPLGSLALVGIGLLGFASLRLLRARSVS